MVQISIIAQLILCQTKHKKIRHEIRLLVPGFMYFDFSETACPIVDFVKNSVKWGQVVLIWLQVCHFCKNLQSAEKPVISRVFGISKMLVVLWWSWHRQPNPLSSLQWDRPLPACWRHSMGIRKQPSDTHRRYDPQNMAQRPDPDIAHPSYFWSADAQWPQSFPNVPAH